MEGGRERGREREREREREGEREGGREGEREGERERERIIPQNWCYIRGRDSVSGRKERGKMKEKRRGRKRRKRRRGGGGGGRRGGGGGGGGGGRGGRRKKLKVELVVQDLKTGRKCGIKRNFDRVISLMEISPYKSTKYRTHRMSRDRKYTSIYT